MVRKNVHTLVIAILSIGIIWLMYQIFTTKSKIEQYKVDVHEFVLSVENKNYSDALSKLKQLELYSQSEPEMLNAKEVIEGLKYDLESLENRQQGLTLSPMEFLTAHSDMKFSSGVTYLDSHDLDMTSDYNTKGSDLLKSYLLGKTFYEYNDGVVDYDRSIQISDDGVVDFIGRRGKFGDVRISENMIVMSLLNSSGDAIYLWNFWDIDNDIIKIDFYRLENGRKRGSVMEPSKYIMVSK